ncbi:MAG: chloride channel protein [Verrucomicrobiota bacterium]
MKWPYHFQALPTQTRTIASTALFGICGGLGAIAFQVCMNALFHLTFGQLSQGRTWVFLVGSFSIIIGTSLVSGWLLTRFCREAAGSGIPQAKLAFWKDFGTIRWRPVWVKFIAGALTVGGGSSLGREGPSVHISSGLASTWPGCWVNPNRTDGGQLRPGRPPG